MLSYASYEVIIEIEKRGFYIPTNNTTDTIKKEYVPVDFSKIKLGIKTLEDAVLSLGTYKKINPSLGNK